MKISVISPIYKGEKMLDELVSRVETAVKTFTEDFEIVPEIVDKTRQIEMDLRDLEDRRKRLHEFIRVLPNIRIRIIMSLRFIDQLSWTDVAAKIGGRETEDTVKKACYRYLESKRQNLGA